MAAVIFIPFSYRFSGQKDEAGIILKGHVAWLFGGLKVKLGYSHDNGFCSINFIGLEKGIDSFKRTGKNNNYKKQKNKDNTKKKKSGLKQYFNRDILKKALECLLKILKYLKPKKFFLRARIGFDDPADTAFMCELYNIGNNILDSKNVNIYFDFENEVFEGRFLIGGSIQVFYFILVGIEFLLTRPFRNILFKNMKIKLTGG
jgi:hypothetical protein